MNNKVQFNGNLHIWLDCNDMSQHIILRNVHIDHNLHTICGKSFRPNHVRNSKSYLLCKACFDRITAQEPSNAERTPIHSTVLYGNDALEQLRDATEKMLGNLQQTDKRTSKGS